MRDIYQILKQPVITEKSTVQRAESNTIAFWVDLPTNKREIKEAVEKVFNVKVLNVNTIRVAGKTKRAGLKTFKRPTRKKAFITLKEGEKIPLFEGA